MCWFFCVKNVRVVGKTMMEKNVKKVDGSCVTKAWELHELELRHFLHKKLGDYALVEDLLQDTFVKALAEGRHFCELENVRAWLFRVTRNRLIDYLRTRKDSQPVPEGLLEADEFIEPVTTLSACLPEVLRQLSDRDREVIENCDLDGMNQQDFATSRNMTLAATKSRLLRARQKLKEKLKVACQVNFDESGKVCCFSAKRESES